MNFGRNIRIELETGRPDRHEPAFDFAARHKFSGLALSTVVC